MNTNVAGWLKVIAAGATGASAVIMAGPITKQSVVCAVLAFLAGTGTAASAFLQAPPTKSLEFPKP